MCMSCGCKQPNEDHGDQRNVTMQDLQDAAQAGDLSTQQVVRNIQEGFQEFGQTAGVGGRESMATSQSGYPQEQFTGSERQGQFTGQGSSSGTKAERGGGQRTAPYEQDYEERQGGYGTGGSNSPQ